MFFTYLFLILFITEWALSGPVPDFGLPGAVPGSAQVIDISNQTSSLLQTATHRLNISLTSNYTKLQTTLLQLGTLAKFTASIDRSVVVPLLAFARDTSGDIGDRFKAVVDGITATQDYIHTTLPVELKSLEILINHYVPDRLNDGFGCVRSGLNQLTASVASLQSAIMASVKEAGTLSVPINVLRKYVNLKTVYDVASAVSAVKICIPSIVESINSTIERLKTADDFILRVNSKLSPLKV
uniref:Protein TsetseEP domain-containing protein n=1 Tax=Anopheles funestus TaxID=62324 RepID=A0A182RTX5_ANOFN